METSIFCDSWKLISIWQHRIDLCDETLFSSVMKNYRWLKEEWFRRYFWTWGWGEGEGEGDGVDVVLTWNRTWKMPIRQRRRTQYHRTLGIQEKIRVLSDKEQPIFNTIHWPWRRYSLPAFALIWQSEKTHVKTIFSDRRTTNLKPVSADTSIVVLMKFSLSRRRCMRQGVWIKTACNIADMKIDYWLSLCGRNQVVN